MLPTPQDTDKILICILTITAKDNRGEILRVENGKIQGSLLSEDIKAFRIFEQSLQQKIEQAKRQKSQT